jgi:hypothetical protein
MVSESLVSRLISEGSLVPDSSYEDSFTVLVSEGSLISGSS